MPYQLFTSAAQNRKTAIQDLSIRVLPIDITQPHPSDCQCGYGWRCVATQPDMGDEMADRGEFDGMEIAPSLNVEDQPIWYGSRAIELDWQDSYRYGSAATRDVLLERCRNRLNYSVRNDDLAGAKIMVARIDWIFNYLAGVTCTHPGLFVRDPQGSEYCPACKTMVPCRNL